MICCRCRQYILQVEILGAHFRVVRTRGRTTAVIDEAVVRDAIQEGAELRAGFVAAATADHFAPHLLEQIVRDFRVARVARQITVQSASMTTIKRLECAQIAACVPKHQLAIVDVSHWVHFTRGIRPPELRARTQRTLGIRVQSHRPHSRITQHTHRCDLTWTAV